MDQRKTNSEHGEAPTCAASRIERARHVEQMVVAFKREGFELSEENKQLQAAYVYGTATLDDLHNRATAFQVGNFVDNPQSANEHLSAGRPIIYVDEVLSASHMIRKWPDGRRELIDVDCEGNIRVISST